MYRKLLVGVVSVFWLSHSAFAAYSDKAIDEKVKQLLETMTVEEKVGQMTQINLGVILKKKTKGKVVFDQAKLEEAVNKYKVGSILNSTSRALTVEEWHEVIKSIQDKALENPRPIPVLYGVDAIHGVTYTKGSTLFPHNIGLGATRNPELVKETVKVTAKEVRASGIRWNFDPVLDAGRNPIWPRFPETYGEDTYLTTVMGVGAVRAYEEDGLDSLTGVASCMKHFVGYSDPQNGKDRTPAYIPDIELWDHYLPQFKAAIEAGSSTIMINSASINGVPVHASKHLLTDVLRGQLGFKGLIVTDWEDVIRLHTRHMVAETPRLAVKLAVEAGIDMSMVPFNFSFAELLVDLVKSGEVSEARIDQSVAIILKLKYQVGLFDNAYAEPEAVKNFGKPSYQTLALEAARESITLLKNEGILPLAKNSKVLLAGPTGNSLAPLHGSWSYSWQGSEEGKYPKSTRTIEQALVKRLGTDKVVSLSVPGFDQAANYDVRTLASAAEGVDVIVLALGENAYAESPGALDELSMPAEQVNLARAAVMTGKPVVLVLAQGRPLIIRDIASALEGILLAYQPGSQGAEAIVDVLFGDYNPNGVLPFSYPQYTGDILPYDRKYLANIQQLEPSLMSYNGYKPQWPFGHGLSYTTFEYSNLKLSKTTISGDDSIKVTVTVTNTGDRDGKHAVELYVSDLFASISPAVKKLRDFDKVFIKRGKSTRVSFVIDKEDLSFVNTDLQRVVEPGEFKAMVGNLEKSFFYE
jgi:beta-glucosidase